MPSKLSPCIPEARSQPQDVNRFLGHLYTFTNLQSDSDLHRATGIHNAQISRWKRGSPLSPANLEKLFTFLAAFAPSPDALQERIAAWGWVLGACETALLHSAWTTAAAQRFPPPPDRYLSRPQLEAAIDPFEHNLLLSGMPGSGRRTLLQAVLRWDARWQRRFPGGLVALEAQGLRGAALFHALEAALWAPQETPPPTLRRQLGRRQRAHQPVLIVLFDLEDPSAWDVLQDIFTAYQPSRLILTTTRPWQPLREEDFRVISVPGFTLEEGLRFLQAPQTETEVLRRIIHRLRGWPLALSLLAARQRVSNIPWADLLADLDAHLLDDPDRPLRALFEGLLESLTPEQRQAALLFGLFPQPRGDWTVWLETAGRLGSPHPQVLRTHLTNRRFVRSAPNAPAQAWEMHPTLHAFLQDRVQSAPDYPTRNAAYRASLYAREIRRQPPWHKQDVYTAWYRQEDLLDLAASFLPDHPERTLRLLLGHDLALMSFVSELPALRDLLEPLDESDFPDEIAALLTDARQRLAQFLADREYRLAHASDPLERGFTAAVLGHWEVAQDALDELSHEERASERGCELAAMLALHQDDLAAVQSHLLEARMAENPLALEESPAYRFLVDWPARRMQLVRAALRATTADD